ncbi:unnamed protein product [Trichobilharzia regenti]|nr:unnamed protein product [Trichobilharzia regenti]
MSSQNCILRDSECLNVELTAYDRAGQVYGVCFLGTISYSTLKQFYDSCVRLPLDPLLTDVFMAKLVNFQLRPNVDRFYV